MCTNMFAFMQTAALACMVTCLFTYVLAIALTFVLTGWHRGTQGAQALEGSGEPRGPPNPGKSPKEKFIRSPRELSRAQKEPTIPESRNIG